MKCPCMVVSRIEPVDKLHKSAPYGIIGLKERGIHDGTNRRADADDSNGSFRPDTRQSPVKENRRKNLLFVYL